MLLQVRIAVTKGNDWEAPGVVVKLPDWVMVTQMCSVCEKFTQVNT